MFANLKIVHKLIALFMCMALLVAVAGGFGIWSIDKVSGKVQEMLKARAGHEKMVVLMKAALQECRVDLLKAALVRSSADDFELFKGDYEVARDRIVSDCDLMLQGNAKLKMEAAPKGSQLESRLLAVKQGVSDFDAVAGKLLARKAGLLSGVKGGGAGQALTSATIAEELNHLALVDISEASDKALVKIDDLLVTVGDQMSQANSEVAAIETGTKITFAVATLAALLLAVILGIVATRHFNRRIKMIGSVLDRGADGDLTVKVKVESEDELGRLGADFNTMTDKLAAMVGKVSKSTEEVTHVSNNLSETTKQVITAARSQADGVIDASSAMTQISATMKGVAHDVDSLSLSAAESSSSILEMAASIEEVALNVETLTQSVGEVSSSIVQMATSVREIDRSVTGLTETFASTASSMMEMDSSIREVEKNALDTATISGEVRRDAETGKEAVVATISGMQEIKRSSGITYEVIKTLSEKADDIGTILSVIDEVAEQTNLLALNAAIIAAQAGERGKGFAVVADEIKELAERTSSSTREIAQVIKGVQDETRRAVEAINQASKSITDGELLSQKSGEALNKIVTGVERASAQMDQIARTTIEQAKGSEMIRNAMEQVLEMVSQIAVATREQGQAGELIMAAAEKMKELTAQVRSSTREQSKVGNFIAKSTENITGMIQQIKRACDEQGRGSELVAVSVEEIKQSTNVNLEATKVLNNAVMNLFRQAEILQKEVGEFKI